MGRVFTRAHPWGVFPPQFGAFAVFPRLLFLYLVLESSLAFVLSGLNFLVLRSRTYKIDSRMKRFAFGMKTENSSKNTHHDMGILLNSLYSAAASCLAP